MAINKVRHNGGIVEHPKPSKLWKYMNIPTPYETPDKYGGYTIEIQQRWFGHPAIKATWLYIVGIAQQDLPTIPHTPIKITRTIENMSKLQREHTPEALAIWLINICHKIEQNKIANVETNIVY